MNVGALRALVIGLGVLILLVFAAVVYGIVGLANPDGNGETANGTSKDLLILSLGLPAGCEIRNAQSNGDRLTIVTDGPVGLRDTCMRVWVLNATTGDVLTEVRP